MPKKDVAWFNANGRSMEQKDWSNKDNKCLGVLLEGRAVHAVDVSHGTEEEGKTLFLISNASHEDVPFKLPKYNYLSKWQVILDTAQPARAVEEWNGGAVKARSVMLLERS